MLVGQQIGHEFGGDNPDEDGKRPSRSVASRRPGSSQKGDSRQDRQREGREGVFTPAPFLGVAPAFPGRVTRSSRDP